MRGPDPRILSRAVQKDGRIKAGHDEAGGFRERMSELLHFEDFPEGEVITYGAYKVTEEEIRAFASQYDPQPFHLDAEAARASLLGGLCASGWHSCAMLNRMNVDAYLKRSAGMGSFGLDEVKWVRPVFPGETLTVRRTTLARRVSTRRPDMGIVTFRFEVMNGDGELKLDARGVNLFKVRGESPSGG